ncbi:hypothetical protein EVAR_39968_1 [Eumeta japonica]|uniref:Uncharacterized protein n=1 Tax=Eumeta variegata TaxID=151549 RepID=A0A4C1X0P8_EUMVA|nr:hypothetical protein EVAR_39968_1 [Eumeta japonica]
MEGKGVIRIIRAQAAALTTCVWLFLHFVSEVLIAPMQDHTFNETFNFKLTRDFVLKSSTRTILDRRDNHKRRIYHGNPENVKSKTTASLPRSECQKTRRLPDRAAGDVSFINFVFDTVLAAAAGARSSGEKGSSNTRNATQTTPHLLGLACARVLFLSFGVNRNLFYPMSWRRSCFLYADRFSYIFSVSFPSI